MDRLRQANLTRIGPIALFGVLLLAHLPAFAADDVFEVKANKQRLHKDEKLIISIHIASFHKRIRNLRYPKNRRFRLKKRQKSYRKEAIYRAGATPKIRHFWTYTYTFQPRRYGTFTFTQARVRIGRKWLKSTPLQITVQKGVTIHRTSSLSPPKQLSARGDIFLSVDIHPKEVYQGQQTIVSTYLFQRVPCDMDYAQLPRYDGFWKEQLFKARALQNWKRRQINGKTYKYTLMTRVALFPLKSGTLTVDPLVLRIKRKLNDVVDKNEYLRSPVVQVRALPLPTTGKPKGFREQHVGRFSIHSQLNQTKVKQGSPIVLTTTVTGTGQIKQLQVTTPTPPSQIEQLSNRTTHMIKWKDNRLQGTHTTTSLFLPKKPGTWKLPGVAFRYFDPWNKQYITKHTTPHTIEVTPSNIFIAKKHNRAATLILPKTAKKRHGASGMGWLTWLVGVLLFPLIGGLWYVFVVKKQTPQARPLHTQEELALFAKMY
ncbi:MAG TPA: hypothetical protein DCE42_18460, partial [Myxococcales bacterium]|nr:hypothetical protein [Myxococcales bacterium]